MRVSRSLVPALTVSILALVSGGWFLQAGSRTQESVLFKARLLEEVHRLVAERYVEEIDPSELYQMAIDGMLYQVGDPYSVFLTPEDYASLQLSTTGNYGGLGIRIQKKGAWITVMGVIPNTPAERRGLQTGDRILQVEGESAEGWSEEQAVSTLRGERGTSVTLTVARVGVERPLSFTVERDAIHVEAIQAFPLDDRVGYLRLEGFNKEATKELQTAIEDLRRRGARSLLLDLRWNSGGLLDEGVAIADLFLPRGEEVVSTRSRLEDQNFTFQTADEDVVANLPIVVLVNGVSASASEILAGALQDHDRALLLGTTTYGKGSVQSLYSLPGGNHLKLTTARWYTPSGRSIHKDRPVDVEETVLSPDGTLLAPDGTPIEAAVDTAGREVFRTDAGRPVYGGGGITPDLIVLPDTVTLWEREFLTRMAEAEVSLVDAAFQFGVLWKARNPGLSEDFQVTPAMREAFYRELSERAGGMDRALYDEARSLVDRQLGIQLANAVFGERARLRRRLEGDRQVEEAVRLLRQADSPEDLFALADAARVRLAGSATPAAGTERRATVEAAP